MAFSFKKFFSAFGEAVKKINPFAPWASFGKAKEVYEKGKSELIGGITSIIKPISLPLFLLIVALILGLIYWKKIQKIIGL